MSHSRLAALSLASLLLCPPQLTLAQAPAAPLDGYSQAASATERNWEEKFRAMPQPDQIRENMRRLSARPHHVGSPYDKDNAEWMLKNFKDWGWDASIETFYVLFPTPKDRLVELVGPTRFTASLKEPALPEDPTSGQSDEQLPTYNAYSGDGDVTAPLVYVNYGTREDYDELDRLGISVKGAIVIARYGAAWRGIKPKVAAEHGAIGCLIYSDPANDGYGVADAFPKGPGRPAEGVQRGGVNDTAFPGDPLTPGTPATKDAKRLDIKDTPIITKIPVLPISYQDATPLLAAITGRVAPRTWRGQLPITYHIGPGAARVHLRMFSNWDIKPIYDVIARIPGTSAADQWVIRGNHHDAWVNGADDPVSGISAELEEARALGQLRKQGWQPRRTILYCAWDGEEPGTLGSTEWVEMHRDELRQHAVMYLNSDSSGRGYFYAEGSHGLEHFINAVGKDIEDPEKKMPIIDRTRKETIVRAHGSERTDAINGADIHIGALGDGSDYVAFQDFAGIPSLDLGFGGEDSGSEYHSIYDDFYWYTHFSDTTFVYGRALAETAGTAVMRMADAELLPYNFNNTAATVSTYVHEVEQTLKDEQEKAADRNQMLDLGVFSATDDPKNPVAAPPRLDTPPYLNFAPLDNGARSLREAAAAYEKLVKQASANGGAVLDGTGLNAVNQALQKTEQAYLLESGLPERSYFKHQLYAPGAYTGYGVKTLPAVRESIEQHKWAQAEKGTDSVAEVFAAEVKAINAAADQLKALLPASN